MGKETARGNAKDGGVFRHYGGNASIYCHPNTGAFEVHGLIRQKYSQLNWELTFLGYPLTDELPTPDGKGRYNHFQGGSIYWHPNTGAFEVHGLIREQWAAFGWEKSYLGYPISDELDDPNISGGKYSNFQGGVLCWNQKDGIKAIKGGKGPDSCKLVSAPEHTITTTTPPQTAKISPSLEPVAPTTPKKQEDRKSESQTNDLKLQIDKLKAENEKLRKENNKLRADNEKLRKECDELRKECDKIRKEITKPSQNKDMTTESAIKQKQSEKPDSKSIKAQPGDANIDPYVNINSDIAALKSDITSLYQIAEKETSDRKQADSQIIPSLKVYWREDNQKNPNRLGYVSAFCDKGDIAVGGAFTGLKNAETSRPTGMDDMDGWEVSRAGKNTKAVVICIDIPSVVSNKQASTGKQIVTKSKSSVITTSPNAGADPLAKIESDIAALKSDIAPLYQMAEKETSDRKQADSQIIPSLKVYEQASRGGVSSVFCDEGDIGLGGGFGFSLDSALSRPSGNGWVVEKTEGTYAVVRCIKIPSDDSSKPISTGKQIVTKSKSSVITTSPNAGADPLAKIESDIAALKSDITSLYQIAEKETSDRKQADSQIIPSLKTYYVDPDRGRSSAHCDNGDVVVGGGVSSALSDEIVYSKPIGKSGLNPRGWEINPLKGAYVYAVCLDIAP
jgi:regulator of replication initiation timing